MSLQSYKLCERCQCVPCCVCCMQCQPFHYFCKECDSRIHDVVIKNNHRRNNCNSRNFNRSFDCNPPHRSRSTNNLNTYQVNNNCVNTKPVNCDQIFTKTTSISPQRNSLNNKIKINYINDINYLKNDDKIDYINI